MSLGLLEVDPCAADFKGKLNYNFEILDAVFPRKVIDVVTSLPVSPSPQDLYILEDDGEFSLQLWDGDEWQFIEMEQGVIYYVSNDNNFLYYDGNDLAWMFSGDILNINGLPYDSDIKDEDYLVYSKENELKKLTAQDLAAYVATAVGGGGGGSNPTGSVLTFAGSDSNVPSGYILCNGQEVSRSVYATLFATIGTAHGSGNGTTTFNVPDYRGRVLRMVSYDSSNDPDATIRTAMSSGGAIGNNVGSTQNDLTKIPSNGFFTDYSGDHTHSLQQRTSNTGTVYTVLSGNYDRSRGGGWVDLISPSILRASQSGLHNHNIEGGDNQTAMKNAYVNFIIKT